MLRSTLCKHLIRHTPHINTTTTMHTTTANGAKNRGVFILFEGLDRSGKTTQSTLLHDYLNKQHGPTTHMRYPQRDTVIGKMINTYLTNKDTELSDRVIHMLFSTNRWETQHHIIDTLNAGTNIVCDRYYYSGIAYTAAKNINKTPAEQIDPVWCANVDAGLPAPDITVFVDITAETAATRGDYGNERYESVAFQSAVRNEYLRLKDHTWCVIDGNGNKEAVFQQVKNVVDRQIGTYQTQPIISFKGVTGTAGEHVAR